MEDETTPVMPPPPPIRKPRKLTHVERVAKFGMFAYNLRPTPEELYAIAVDPAWEHANIVTIEVLWKGVPKKLRVHRKAAPAFLQLWAAWKNRGLTSQIVTINGTYVPRMMRGKTPPFHDLDLSNHSWGTAIDINARWNPRGRPGAKVSDYGSNVLLVPDASRLGFVWGGDWTGKSIDPMHFEFSGS